MQEAFDRVRALDEPLVHRLEEQEELGDVLQELAAEQPIGHLVEGPARHVDHARAPLAAHAVGHREPSEEPAAEELGHPLRRVEEVERVPGRRGVHDDQVELACFVDLEEALHRDVVVALHEARGDVLVEAVVEDPVGGLLVGRVAQHERVPRLLGVEHRGPQLTADLETGGLEGVLGDALLRVADPLEAECVGEPLGRVDREHEHLAAEPARRAECRGRGDSGLAHATGAAADDDLLRREQGLEARGRHSPSSWLSASATIRVSRSPCVREKR